MWQIAIAAAAVAGSGLLATKKHLTTTTTTTNHDPQHQQQHQIEEEYEDHNNNNNNGDSNLAPESLTTPLNSPITGHILEESAEGEELRVFRFSSSGSRNENRSRTSLKGLRKMKKVVGFRAIRPGGGNADAQKAVKGAFVCLKKNKKCSKFASLSSAAPPSSKDSSVFGWGVGVGIMYMMSAGKAEISKLNTAMDETTKAVQELKEELCKRKSSPGLQDSCPTIRCDAVVSKKFKDKHTEPVFSPPFSNNRNFNDFNVTEHDRCGSSRLTEERGSDVLEMDQLEAELESELLKLSCCTTETSLPEGLISSLDKEAEVPEISKRKQKDDSLNANQFHGVIPYELDRKLSRLLIGQQESQIVELESELQSANNKLDEKEAELQALKDCVRRLTECSLSTVPADQENTNELNTNTC